MGNSLYQQAEPSVTVGKQLPRKSRRQRAAGCILRRKKLLANIAQAVFLVIILGFLGQSIIAHWETVRRSAVQMEWDRFTLAVGLWFATLPVLSVPTYIAVRTMIGPIAFRDTTAMFFVSQAAKYLPGGLWVVPGRMLLYQQRLKIGTFQGGMSVIWESITLGTGALIVMTLWAPLPNDAVFLPVLYAGILGVLAVGMLWFRRAVTCHTVERRLTFVTRLTGIQDNYTPLKPRALIGMALGATLFWVLTGVAFYTLLSAVPGAESSISLYEAAGVYACAWLTGFLAIIFPAGLGVRETMLAYLLTHWYDPGRAVFAAMLMRLWCLLGEVAWILVGLVMLHFMPVRAEPEDD
jgi:uncharacterized membrane protein YbhN (UPF0104 family)